jgi:hypothetical protein
MNRKIASRRYLVDRSGGIVLRTRKQARGGNSAPSAARLRTLHSRPPLYRFQEIFHAIKAGRYPNRTQLAHAIEVTTKTIQRDLDYMRYQLDVPIEFDYARGGYYFAKPVTELPLFQLTEAELVSIFVGQKALEPTEEARSNNLFGVRFRNSRRQQGAQVPVLVLVGKMWIPASRFETLVRIFRMQRFLLT